MSERGERGSFIQRVLLLINYMDTRRRVPVGELCERLGFTRKELDETVRLLTMCGLPDYSPWDLITIDRDGDFLTFQCSADLRRPVQLTQREATALILAAQFISRTPFRESESLGRAIAKIEAVLPSNVREYVAHLRERAVVELPAIADEELRSVLAGAIEERRRVRIQYYSHGKRALSERLIEPIRFAFKERGWYLAARDCGDGKVKSFILSRINSVEVTDDRFELDPETDASANRMFDDSVWPGGGRHAVTLLVRGEAAKLIGDIVSFEEAVEDDGGLRVSFQTGELDWVLTDIVLPYAGSVTIVAPDELKAKLAEEVRRLRALYGSR